MTNLKEAWLELCKLCAEGKKLRAEGSKLWAEGSLIFINAVIEVYGKDAAIEWADNGATVNGEVFAFVEGEK